MRTVCEITDEVRIALIVGVPLLVTSLLSGFASLLGIWLTHRVAMAQSGSVRLEVVQRMESVSKDVAEVHKMGNSHLQALLASNTELERLNARLTERVENAADLQAVTERVIDTLEKTGETTRTPGDTE